MTYIETLTVQDQVNPDFEVEFQVRRYEPVVGSDMIYVDVITSLSPDQQLSAKEDIKALFSGRPIEEINF